jgi:ribonuclease E
MADTTEVAEKVAHLPSREQLERVEKFTREPFAPDQDALRPGTARRRALDAALAEIEAGLEVPSIEWRQQYSLLLGLERLLADDEPKLADGTVLSAHQVDALSGTLTALIAEAERQNGNGAAILEDLDDLDEEEDEEPDEAVEDDAADADDGEPEDWDDSDVLTNGSGQFDEEEQLP